VFGRRNDRKGHAKNEDNVQGQSIELSATKIKPYAMSMIEQAQVVEGQKQACDSARLDYNVKV